MAPDIPDLVATDRYNMWLTMEEMLTWRPQADVAKPYPPKPVPAPVPLTLSPNLQRGREPSNP
jgi:NADH-quinone oxidoreductase subunit I